MGYTPSFTPQYENGWENLPSETSPITAEAFNAYDDAIENIENYLASDESQANLADAYDETATYSEGDYVIYGGDLYKCLEDIDEPEEWDSTKWESCLITDEMATSGGTTVIANPEGEATDTLNKLQVENTIYSIEGGGGTANIWTGTQAELEEVFDELENGTQINITDDEEHTQAFDIYSTDEQVIGTWIDGKPLYRRTITGLSISMDADNWIYYEGISDVDNLVNLHAYYNGANGFLTCVIAEYQRSTNHGVMMSGISSAFNRTINVITIEYTKTTD